MKRFKKSRWLALAVAAAAMLWALAPSADVARAVSPSPTPEQLTAIWWQWVFSIPVADNPLFDETGAKAATAQPFKDVFFLVGVGGASGTAERSITIPKGTALFFPILNVEWDNVLVTKHLGGTAHKALSIPQMRALAAAGQDGATVAATISDGKTTLPVPIARLQSPVFMYMLPKQDNILQSLGIDISGPVAPAVSDGYWSYIPPLSAGTYTLHFTGTTADESFTLDITYHIKVK